MQIPVFALLLSTTMSTAADWKPSTSDVLFSQIERWQHELGAPYGTVLDAGTGDHSLKWLSQLRRAQPEAGVAGIVAVTADPNNLPRLRGFMAKQAGGGAEGDAVLVGNWFAKDTETQTAAAPPSPPPATAAAAAVHGESEQEVAIGGNLAGGGEGGGGGGGGGSTAAASSHVSSLLAGQTFDVVIADYLLGAVECFAPYRQVQLFKRMRQMFPRTAAAPAVCSMPTEAAGPSMPAPAAAAAAAAAAATSGAAGTPRRLYIVGMQPLPHDESAVPLSAYGGDRAVATEARELVLRLAQARDAAITLAGHIPHREYPVSWAREALAQAGFRVLEERRFGNVYGEGALLKILGTAESKLHWLGAASGQQRGGAGGTGAALAEALRAHIEALRQQVRDFVKAHGSARLGFDYVLAAEPVDVA
jgi:hypothetical protein